MPTLITSADQVTSQWLTTVLEQSGAADGATVESFTAEAVGTGQMGENARFTLEWSNAQGRPATVVGKFPSDNEISRATATGGGAYAREVNFYREVAPTVRIRIPRCHFAEIDDETGLFVLVMEDLAPGVQGDQLAGCTPDQASTALDELVKLQAPRWNDPSLADIEWLSRRQTRTATITMLYEAVLPGFMDRIGVRLDDESGKLVQGFAAQIDRWRENTSIDHLVVTHGDYRLDNMMFGAIGPDADPLAVVDWQTPGHGVPGTDLSYFLGAGLLPNARAANERDLIVEYHSKLVAAGVAGYSLDECWASYRRESFSGIIMAVVASQIVVQTDRGDDMFFAMASRHARQALDLEAEAVI